MFPYHDDFFELVEIYMMKIFFVEQMYWLLTSALPGVILTKKILHPYMIFILYGFCC